MSRLRCENHQISSSKWSSNHPHLPSNETCCSLLDDAEGARNSISDINKNLKVYADASRTRNWDLLHGGGVLTLEHHDAEGFITWLKMLTGGKLWSIIRPAGYTEAKTRKELQKLNDLFLREDWEKRGLKLPESWALEWERNGGEVHVIEFSPGDLV